MVMMKMVGEMIGEIGSEKWPVDRGDTPSARHRGGAHFFQMISK
jgi:hypothetical protein